MALIRSARSSIDLESEELDYQPATAALCAAARRGVNVRVVMTYSSSWAAAYRALAGCGVHVRVYYGQSYYIHAKLLVVDGHTALVGSQNLSAESLCYNRELSIKLTTPALVRALAAGFNADYTGGQRLPHAGS